MESRFNSKLSLFQKYQKLDNQSTCNSRSRVSHACLYENHSIFSVVLASRVGCIYTKMYNKTVRRMRWISYRGCRMWRCATYLGIFEFDANFLVFVILGLILEHEVTGSWTENSTSSISWSASVISVDEHSSSSKISTTTSLDSPPDKTSASLWPGQATFGEHLTSSKTSSQSSKMQTIMHTSYNKTTRALPRENENWKSIQSDKKTYVDKTQFLLEILKDDGKLFLILRPQKFGKSTFLQMTGAFFQGKKEYFENTAMENVGNVQFRSDRYLGNHDDDHPKKWMEYPVIYMNFTHLKYFTLYKKFRKGYTEHIKAIARVHKTKLPNYEDDLRLSNLILALRTKFRQPVVILIDEYDAPIRRALYSQRESQSRYAKQLMEFFEEFFDDIKNCVDDNIRLVLITGISRYRLTSLENFIDLTYDKKFATAFGFTQKELENYFPLESWKDCRWKLLEQYCGYQFAERNDAEAVLNPISVIDCLREGEVRNFWCKAIRSPARPLMEWFFDENGTPLYRLEDFVNFKISKAKLMAKYNPVSQRPNLIVHMFLNGYLTIKKYDEKLDLYELGYPNKEVKENMETNFLTYLPSKRKFSSECSDLRQSITRALKNNCVADFVEILNGCGFPQHPADYTRKNYLEGEITKRLDGLLRSFRLSSLRNIKLDCFLKQSSIDVLVYDLPVNYVIKVRCSIINATSTTDDAMHQLLEYIKNCNETFEKAVEYEKNGKKIYLLSLGFTLHKSGCKLTEWTLLPYVDGNITFDAVETSNPELAMVYRNGKSRQTVKEIIKHRTEAKVTIKISHSSPTITTESPSFFKRLRDRFFKLF